jgi:MEDS: MEthanogen/methylotroph, DcmR Sensory domain
VDSQAQYRGEPSITLAGSVLGDKRHIAGFFCNLEEQYEVLLPFMKEGFDRGENAFHVVSPTQKQNHAKRLMDAGIDVAEAEKDGRYQLRDWDEVYYCDGCFDQDRMLNTWKNLLDTSGSNGLPRTRLIAQMEWALEDRDVAGDMVEYEARFNNVHRGSSDPAICVYDLSKFSANVIGDALRTHPMVIMGGVLQENPHYTPPEEFLREFLGRRLKERHSGNSR